MAGAATIVEREVLRGQRRWQTFAWRALFTGLLFVGFAFSYRDVTRYLEWGQASELAWVGRRLFEFTMLGQWWLLGLMTPILVAQGIVEERNQGTLELLTISHITPEQLLRGKVLASLSRIGLLMLGTMPIVALSLAFGGVAPLSLLSAYACTAVMVLTLAALAAFYALFARGPLMPLLMSWITAFIGWMVLPLPAVMAMDDEDGFGWVSLGLVFAKSLSSPEWWTLGTCLLWTGMSLAILRFAGRVFSTLVSSSHGEDADAGLLSVELWGLEAIKRRQGLRWMLLVFTSPVIAVSALMSGKAFWLLVPSYVWVLVWVYTAMHTVLLASRAALLKAASLQRGRGLSRAEKRALVDDVAPRTRGQRPLGAREVWGNPVAWRETVTTAHGFLTRVVGKLYIAGLLVTIGLVHFSGYVRDAEQMFLVAAGFGFVGTALLAVLLGTASMVGEQRRGTLALLCVTPLGGGGVVAGKLLGLLVYLLPPFAVSAVFGLMGAKFFSGHRSWYSDVPDTDVMLTRFASLVWIAFAATVFLAAGSLWLAARMKTPTRAWMANLGATALLAFGPVLAMASVNGREPVKSIVAWFNPVLSEGFWSNQLPSPVFPSGVFWLMAAGLLTLHNAASLSRVAR